VTAPRDAFERQRRGRRVKSIPNMALAGADDDVEGTAQDSAMRTVRNLTFDAIAGGSFAYELYRHSHLLVPAIQGNRSYFRYWRRKFDKRDIVGRCEKCIHLGKIAGGHGLLD